MDYQREIVSAKSDGSRTVKFVAPKSRKDGKNIARIVAETLREKGAAAKDNMTKTVTRWLFWAAMYMSHSQVVIVRDDQWHNSAVHAARRHRIDPTKSTPIVLVKDGEL